ncbi:MAG: HesA/MoeB/ThiF family protein [Chlorobi bacterium]|nr:HesA/MoeB/ThiF family protein [Chlorobiota bacterium]
MNTLTQDEINRYNRHLIIPEFNIEHQEKLKGAKVLVVGVGGLGSPLVTYLTAAGVGTIGIIDDDIVSESNLQRQVIYSQNDVGLSKVDCAEKRMKGINPNVNVIKHASKLTKENAEEIISEFDIVCDGTDNYEARYTIDDICADQHKPYIYGSIAEFKGQASVFHYGIGKSYRDLYPEAPQEKVKKDIGVIGALPGIIGSIQANETIKIISGLGETLDGRLLLFDALTMKFTVLGLE